MVMSNDKILGWGVVVKRVYWRSLQTPTKTNQPCANTTPSIFCYKHLTSCVDGWVGVVDGAEGVCCMALRHSFQCEENKSICEVATGAECTFAVGACCESPCACLCFCVGATMVTGWLASAVFGLPLGSLASKLCYYQSLVTHRHDHKCITVYSSF